MKILIIGCGFAGQRFITVLDYLSRLYPEKLKIAGVVDPKIGHFSLPEGVPQYLSLEDALVKDDYDGAVVAVNERDHYHILKRLALTPITHILCEKPLTETLDQAENLKPFLAGKKVFMNMVERYSPVFEDFFKWRAAFTDLKVNRVNLHWGKNRLLDSRPTMGVLSEAIHPLDLMMFAFGIKDFSPVSGFTHNSNFTCHEGAFVADSLHCKLRNSSGATISLHTSFSWAKRRREISAVLSSGGNSYLAAFTFDVPRWDCDTIKLSYIDPRNGKLETILDKAYVNEDFPDELRQLNKVKEFAAQSLGLYETENTRACRVDLDHAIFLQNSLDTLEKSFNHSGNDPVEVMFPTYLEKAGND